eukprot:362768-Chlamydomonas_euryale.AAC.3
MSVAPASTSASSTCVWPCLAATWKANLRMVRRLSSVTSADSSSLTVDASPASAACSSASAFVVCAEHPKHARSTPIAAQPPRPRCEEDRSQGAGARRAEWTMGWLAASAAVSAAASAAATAAAAAAAARLALTGNQQYRSRRCPRRRVAARHACGGQPQATAAPNAVDAACGCAAEARAANQTTAQASAEVPHTAVCPSLGPTARCVTTKYFPAQALCAHFRLQGRPPTGETPAKAQSRPPHQQARPTKARTSAGQRHDRLIATAPSLRCPPTLGLRSGTVHAWASLKSLS